MYRSCRGNWRDRQFLAPTPIPLSEEDDAADDNDDNDDHDDRAEYWDPKEGVCKECKSNFTTE